MSRFTKLLLLFFSIILIVGLLFIFLNLIYWNLESTEDYSNQEQVELEQKISELKEQNYLTKDPENQTEFDEMRKRIESSQKEVEDELNQIDELGLEDDIKSELERDLRRLLNYHRFAGCFVHKWQEDTSIQEQLEELDSLNNQNLTVIAELTKQRQTNLQSANECFSNELTVFALNSTSTDIQRNNFTLEKVKQNLGNYDTIEEVRAAHDQMNFFGEINRRALENQANSFST